MALHQHGQLTQAEGIYRAILKVLPDDFHALHLLGIARAQQAKPAEAEAYLRRAVAIEPGSAEAHSNLGNALQSLQRHADAIASYDRALAVRPPYPEALNYRGNSLQVLGFYDAAIASYDQALAVRPGYAEALYNRANALNVLGRHAEADASCAQALALAPDYAEALNLRGIALQALNRSAEAIASYDRALAIRPEYAVALNNRGIALQALNRHAEAVDSYDRALAIRLEYADALNNRGNALEALGRHAEALASYERALALAPAHAEAHTNRGLALLRSRDFARGWVEYEWRWRKKDFQKNQRGFAQPRWEGPAGSGTKGRLLVWGEQGIGDEIIFASMLPDLLAAGLELTVETDSRLVALFARSFARATVIPRLNPPHAAATHAAIDFQIPLANLGRWLRPAWSSFPARHAYLAADRERAAQFGQELRQQHGKPVIGLSWKSRGLPFKSLRLPDFAPLLAAHDATFVGLQYGDTAAERRELAARAGKPVLHLPGLDLFDDLDGVAALVHACDLVITSSNVVAHFAGALGKPVWILLPAGEGLLWYWFSGTDESPWYRTARLFRQPRVGDWPGVLDRVARELSTWIQDFRAPAQQ